MKRIKDVRIVFMGTPAFALPSLRALHQKGFNIQAVVTQPDRPRGRGRRPRPSPVKELAQSLGLVVLQPEKASAPEFIHEVRAMNPDFLVVAAYGQILKQQLLDVPAIMPVNVHGSLLPKWRGAAPIQRAILHGEAKTGITIMKMDAGMDTGPILLKEETPIREDDTFGTLHDRLADMGARLLIQALLGILDGRIHPVPQPDHGATYAPPVAKEELEIRWQDPALLIHRKIRSLDPVPGAFTYLEGQRIRVYSPRFVDTSKLDQTPGPCTDSSPGTVVGVTGNLLLVATGDGILGLEEIHLPGKKRMKIGEFLRGHTLKKGMILGNE